MSDLDPIRDTLGIVGRKVEKQAEKSEKVRKVHPHCDTCGKDGYERDWYPGISLPSMCRECQAIQKDREEAARNLEKRLHDSCIPARFADAKKDDVDPAIWSRLLPWIQEETPFGVLSGPTGTGKSYIAAIALRGEIMDGETGLWMSVPTMTLKLRRLGSQAEDVMDSALKAPCLVLDDLGAERSTDYALEMMSCLILSRWDACLRTLVTTNASLDQLNDLHPRMASRLASGIVISLEGEDRRL